MSCFTFFSFSYLPSKSRIMVIQQCFAVGKESRLFVKMLIITPSPPTNPHATKHRMEKRINAILTHFSSPVLDMLYMSAHLIFTKAICVWYHPHLRALRLKEVKNNSRGQSQDSDAGTLACRWQMKPVHPCLCSIQCIPTPLCRTAPMEILGSVS